VPGTQAAGCLNCGATLEGPFCAQCGQKDGPVNPTVHDLLHDLAHEFLHFDGKIVQSVRLLLTAPGALTRELFEGRRVRHVSPIRLYLTFSVLYFAVAAIAPPPSNLRVEVTPDSDPAVAATETPEDLERRDQEVERTALVAIGTWIPRVMFVLVPIFAGLVALAARKSGYTYPQHLYFALHVHAASFAVLAVSAAASIRRIPVVTPAVSVLANLYVVMYLVLALRRAYRLSAWRAALRGAAVGIVYSLLVLLAFLAIVLPAIGVFGR
jgi:hypothetical protein